MHGPVETSPKDEDSEVWQSMAEDERNRLREFLMKIVDVEFLSKREMLSESHGGRSRGFDEDVEALSIPEVDTPVEDTDAILIP